MQQNEQAPAVVEGAVKTGIAVVGNAGDSKDATEAAFDVTIVGVTVDDNGVIQSCVIDGLGAKALTDHKFLSQMLNTSGEAEVGTNVDANCHFQSSGAQCEFLCRLCDRCRCQLRCYFLGRLSDDEE